MKENKLNLIKENLPKYPNILGKEEYYNSAVLLLLIPIDGEYHFILEKRCSNIRQGGEICFPGGMYEPDKDSSLEMTALRETNEELGIPIDRIKIIGKMDTLIVSTGVTVDIYVGETDLSIDEINIDPAEVERVFTIPVSFFEAREPEVYKALIKVYPSYKDATTNEHKILLPSEELGLPERYYHPWEGIKYKVYVYKTEFGLVWGITARIIYYFLKY